MLSKYFLASFISKQVISLLFFIASISFPVFFNAKLVLFLPPKYKLTPTLHVLLLYTVHLFEFASYLSILCPLKNLTLLLQNLKIKHLSIHKLCPFIISTNFNLSNFSPSMPLTQTIKISKVLLRPFPYIYSVATSEYLKYIIKY